ncbi:7-alpha-hydroxycholest-4-en-3-one 12-alpha-hydroxylase [Lachnellula willkommii]|uniref:7-alpha-hydroxycholest-4-en-3-one 12-alpha-hydroxylase n=1 Tax=Lachnellula willkommii TaxID=215461 RepID=A0A559MAY9_9HELO|nr:7-alpha-hydroxycholest-4-en-3-one 12-alpha-hydroxylase [Lachnellula willkommii]
MPSTLAVVATGAFAIYGFLHLLLHYTQDAREPPPVATTLPFIGTAVGLPRKKNRYYVELRNKNDLPIYTIRLPGARLYVVNSISLISAVQRQFKVLAFPPLEAKLAMSVTGTSETANDILNTNMNGEEGDWGYSMTFYKMIHTPLSPGPELDAMNRVMAQKVSASIDCIKGQKAVRLFEFIKHEIALATTDSAYGPKNPFNDAAIVDAFWKYQNGIMKLLIGMFPSLFASESLAAREFMVKAFLRYFEEGGHNEASALMKSRFEHSTEHKIPVEDIARFEVGNTIGLLTNTAPAAFWMVYHLYSSPVALEECREELSKVVSDDVSTATSGETTKVYTIDMSQVKASCPVLLSTLQEVLRIHTVGISTRLVMEDHMLDNKYLLKKGNTVMIPGPVQHTSTSTWGPNVNEFDHRRFLPKNKRHNPVAFRAFGGGTTLCPGRHFASTEILAFTALLILRFEVAPADGIWTRLTTDKAALWETTPVPDEDIKVKISPRDDADISAKWRVLVSDSDKAMPLSAEDL